MTRRVVLVVLLTVCGPPVSAADWKVQVLGTYEGNPTLAAAVNARGVVVGNTWIGGDERPLMWTEADGYSLFLGDTPGRAHDINDRGQIVGITRTGGFLWSDQDGLVDLGMFYPTRIANNGTIGGMCFDVVFDPLGRDPINGPCIWDDGMAVPVVVEFSGVAMGINDRGAMVGYTDGYDTPSEVETPFIRLGDEPQLLPLPPTSHSGWAASINNRGLVVGGSWTSRANAPLVWDGRRGIVLPAPDVNGVAVAINNRGDIVGVDYGLRRGIVWSTRTDLAYLPGGDTNEATDINERGDVVGWVSIDGRQHAAIWTFEGPAATARRP
jgi:hypothetical protein